MQRLSTANALQLHKKQTSKVSDIIPYFSQNVNNSKKKFKRSEK